MKIEWSAVQTIGQGILRPEGVMALKEESKVGLDLILIPLDSIGLKLYFSAG